MFHNKIFLGSDNNISIQTPKNGPYNECFLKNTCIYAMYIFFFFSVSYENGQYTTTYSGNIQNISRIIRPLLPLPIRMVRDHDPYQPYLAGEKKEHHHTYVRGDNRSLVALTSFSENGVLPSNSHAVYRIVRLYAPYTRILVDRTDIRYPYYYGIWYFSDHTFNRTE
jgi:hypothetical protein